MSPRHRLIRLLAGLLLAGLMPLPGAARAADMQISREQPDLCCAAP